MTQRFAVIPENGKSIIVAKMRVRDPKDGAIIYEPGEVVPSSEGSRADCELWVTDLERRYAGARA